MNVPPAGRTLNIALYNIADWADANLETVTAARVAYEAVRAGSRAGPFKAAVDGSAPRAGLVPPSSTQRLQAWRSVPRSARSICHHLAGRVKIAV